MLSIPGFVGLKKIFWKDIEPGMIILGGIKINGTTPFELVNYPALTIGQIYEMTQKYHFKKDKEIIVAVCKKGESPQKMSLGFNSIEKRIKSFNEWRKKIFDKKEEIIKTLKLNTKSFLSEEKIIQLESKQIQKFNSITIKHKLIKKKPSCFHNPSLTLSLNQVLSGEIKKTFFLPEDFPLLVHLGLGYSKNFKELFLPAYQSSLEFFTEMFSKLLEKAKFEVYAVGENLISCQFPLSGREVLSQEIHACSFLKRVMHKKNKEITNLTIFILPQKPKDWNEFLTLGEKFVKASIDIIFLFLGNWSSSDILQVSNSYNANTIFIKYTEALPIVFMEVLDDYLGQITLERTPISIPEFKEFELPKNPVQEEPKKEKVVKPFEFKKITKKDLTKQG